MVAEHHVMPEITHAAMKATDAIGMECCVEVRTLFMRHNFNCMKLNLSWMLANSILKMFHCNYAHNIVTIFH